jgi:eukaryotic-like serine/threonine-protein kinase
MTTLASARELHYCPLEAEALVIEGAAEADWLAEEATKILEKAIVVAQSCGHDRVVAEAAVDLVSAYSFDDVKSGERYAALAAATLERLGGDARLEGWLANNVGELHLMQGQLNQGMNELERAVRIKASHLGQDHIDVALSEGNLVVASMWLGRLDDALAISDRVLATHRRWMPPDAANLCGTLNNRSEVLIRLDRLDEAETSIREALRILEDRNEKDPRVGGILQGTFGKLLVARGEPRDAVPYLERALNSRRQDAPFQVADTQFELAKAREMVSAGDPQALDLARQAESTLATLPDLAAEHSRIVAWLVAHKSAKHTDRDPPGHVRVAR